MKLLEETFMLKLICLIMHKKRYLKNAAEINTSKLAAKLHLDSLKAKIDKSDIDKLVPVPVDLKSQLVVKKLFVIN